MARQKGRVGSSRVTEKKALVAQMQKKKYLNVVGPIENIEVLEGWAKFTDKHTIEVNGKTYQAKKWSDSHI